MPGRMGGAGRGGGGPAGKPRPGMGGPRGCAATGEPPPTAEPGGVPYGGLGRGPAPGRGCGAIGAGRCGGAVNGRPAVGTACGGPAMGRIGGRTASGRAGGAPGAGIPPGAAGRGCEKPAAGAPLGRAPANAGAAGAAPGSGGPGGRVANPLEAMLVDAGMLRCYHADGGNGIVPRLLAQCCCCIIGGPDRCACTLSRLCSTVLRVAVSWWVATGTVSSCHSCQPCKRHAFWRSDQAPRSQAATRLCGHPVSCRSALGAKCCCTEYSFCHSVRCFAPGPCASSLRTLSPAGAHLADNNKMATSHGSYSWCKLWLCNNLISRIRFPSRALAKVPHRSGRVLEVDRGFDAEWSKQRAEKGQPRRIPEQEDRRFLDVTLRFWRACCGTRGLWSVPRGALPRFIGASSQMASRCSERWFSAHLRV